MTGVGDGRERHAHGHPQRTLKCPNASTTALSVYRPRGSVAANARARAAYSATSASRLARAGGESVRHRTCMPVRPRRSSNNEVEGSGTAGLVVR